MHPMELTDRVNELIEHVAQIAEQIDKMVSQINTLQDKIRDLEIKGMPTYGRMKYRGRRRLETKLGT